MSRRPDDGGDGPRGRISAVAGRLGRGQWLLVAILLAVAGAGIVAVVLGDRDVERSSASERLRDSVSAVVAPEGTVRESDRALGLTYDRPRDWRRARREGSLVLTSPDRAVTLAISTPGRRVDAGALRGDAIATIRDAYRGVEEVGRAPGRFGPSRVQSVELTGTSSGGQGIRALVIAASGPEKTYVATLFSGRTPSVARLAEARVVLRSIRFPG